MKWKLILILLMVIPISYAVEYNFTEKGVFIDGQNVAPYINEQVANIDTKDYIWLWRTEILKLNYSLDNDTIFYEAEQHTGTLSTILPFQQVWTIDPYYGTKFRYDVFNTFGTLKNFSIEISLPDIEGVNLYTNDLIVNGFTVDYEGEKMILYKGDKTISNGETLSFDPESLK